MNIGTIHRSMLKRAAFGYGGMRFNSAGDWLAGKQTPAPAAATSKPAPAQSAPIDAGPEREVSDPDNHWGAQPIPVEGGQAQAPAPAPPPQPVPPSKPAAQETAAPAETTGFSYGGRHYGGIGDFIMGRTTPAPASQTSSPQPAAPAPQPTPAPQPQAPAQEAAPPQQSAPQASATGVAPKAGKKKSWFDKAADKARQLKDKATSGATMMWLKNNWHKIALPALGLIGGLAMGGKDNKLPWALAGGLGMYALANSGWGNSIKDWGNSLWAGGGETPAPAANSAADTSQTAAASTRGWNADSVAEPKAPTATA